MKKITLSTNLSIKQIQELKKQLNKIKQAEEIGCQNFVQYATQKLCELFKINCEKYNLNTNEILSEYDKDKKIGRVYTDDMIIIFNEFGTGIKGTQDEWANNYGYQVNKSGKGEEGWWYPTDEQDPNPHKWVNSEGNLRALTHGLDSRHMLYDAYMQLQSEIGDIIEITIGKAIGDLY